MEKIEEDEEMEMPENEEEIIQVREVKQEQQEEEEEEKKEYPKEIQQYYDAQTTPSEMIKPGDKTANGVLHMAYFCPGLHGPDCRQRIEPMSFEKYLQTTGRLIIPLFQRSYCWGKGVSTHLKKWGDAGSETNLAEGWWRDMNNASSGKQHRVGKIILYKDPYSETTQLLVVDGQQRTTTTQLLLIAIRDAAYSINAAYLIEQIHDFIFYDK